MAKIVTIQLLVSEDDETTIVDSVDDILCNLIEPAVPSAALRPFIIDFDIAFRMREVSSDIEDGIKAGSYSKGSAFPGTEYYALITEGYANMRKLGPFADADARDAAAREHRRQFGPDDALHWLQVSPAGFVDVGDFGGDELEEQSEARDLANRLYLGERIIERQPGGPCFKLRLEGEEKMIDNALVEEIQGHCSEDLVIIRQGETDFVVLASQARSIFKQQDWVNAVVRRETMDSYSAWTSEKVGQLDKAVNVSGTT